MMRRSMFRALALGLLLVGAARGNEGSASSLVVKDGDSIAFLGDSITAAGAKPGGYVSLVMDALQKEGLNVSSIPAGVSGHRSSDMLARLEKDVIAKKPTWLVLSCGVNDVWHFKLKLGKRTFQGVPLDEYKKNIGEIIDTAQRSGIKVLVLTATMIGEDPDRELNTMLVPYNDFLREVAREKKCLLADLNKDMQEAIAKIPDERGHATMFGEPGYKRDIKNKLTTDGCHMNPLGNIMMAKGVLRSLGMADERVAAIEQEWLANPPPSGKKNDKAKKAA